MTWPFENDTSYLKRKIAKRDLISNKKSNIIIVVTVILMELFVSAILGIGFSYYKNMEKMQQLLYGRMSDLSTSTPLSLFALLGVVFFVLVAAYLLIYNVLFFCVSKNIRLYGQIKTIGGTKKQLRSIFMFQSAVISNIGILIGIVLFSVLNAFFVPPILLRLIGDPMSQLSNIKVSFSPVIFFISILSVKITTRFCYSRIVKLAGNFSPVESIKIYWLFWESKKQNK